MWGKRELWKARVASEKRLDYEGEFLMTPLESLKYVFLLISNNKFRYIELAEMKMAIV